MPEIKNTFLKSKMNKDLDARIIPSGEYRDGQNVSVSTSEGADVGALENIRGNFNLTDFGLTDKNLEVIGNFVDTANNRIYFFITNFADGTRSQLDGQAIDSSTASSSLGTFTRNGAKNCIAYCEIPYLEDSQLSGSSITSGIIVEGTFLNFSKTHPMLGVNLVEDLLFFTDNRNQPRKINVKTAIANPLTYYVSEDDISVAKVAPFKPISFLNETVTPVVSTLKNEVDEYLPAVFLAPGEILNNGSTDGLLFEDASVFGNPSGKYASPVEHFLSGNTSGNNVAPSFPIRVYRLEDENKNYAFVQSFTSPSNPGAGDFVRLKKDLTNNVPITNIGTDLGWTAGTFAFEIKNPDYNAFFAGDKELLKDKFIKFSYRFKYDDDEYSITAPFSQTAFVPKQYGYFIGNDDEKTKESSIVSFMENQITTAGLVIDLPYPVNEVGPQSGKKLKIKEVQILYKQSDEQSLKVISDVDISKIKGIPATVSIFFNGDGFSTQNNKATTGGSGSGLTLNINSVSGSGKITSVSINSAGQGYLIGDVVTIEHSGSGVDAVIRIESLSSTFIYEYSSQKPIKVLDEQEIIRVNDIIPIRAKAQEVVGNRVVYGNFLQNLSTPNSLNYVVATNDKGTINNNNKKEFLNHTLKQGRTYQVGLVLQDRYGRSSNIIVNNNTDSETINSTFFAPYTNGGTNPLSWPGNSLSVSFNEEIPIQKTSTYNGVYNEITNPLGWYTYKVVVKQQDQDYYNVYVPGAISGNVNFVRLDVNLTYTETSSKAHISLFNDNINKIPRDLNEVGPSDRTYSSSVILYNRVKNTKEDLVDESTPSNSIPNLNEQSTDTSNIEVISVKPFSDFGQWTAMKNVNVRFIDSKSTADDAGAIKITGPYVPTGSKTPADLISTDKFYIYPGTLGNVDPLFLKNNKNPLVATLETGSRLGFNSGAQQDAIYKFSKQLMVFETKPFKSNIEIYYETSSTGLVSDFNTSVAYPTGASGQPSDISTFIATWQETIAVGSDVTNVFQCVDSNNNLITGGNPQIRILDVKNSTSNTSVNNPFNLTVVQQAGFNQPETYKLINRQETVYDGSSYQDDSLLIDFQLTADGMQPVVVQKSVSLTNIVPKIYRIKGPGQTGYLEEKTQADVNAFKNSNFSNQIQFVASPVSSGGSPIDYSTVSTAIVRKAKDLDNNNTMRLDLGEVSHSSNGSEQLSSFTSNTTDTLSNNSPRNSRVVGLIYNIHEVIRYRCHWNDDNKKFYRVNEFQGTTDQQPTLNKTSDFEIVNPTNTSYGLREIRFLTSGSSSSLDFGDFTTPSGFQKAFLYVITLKISDAARSQGFKESFFNIFMILTKNNSSMF